jgi:hypothetical protein
VVNGLRNDLADCCREITTDFQETWTIIENLELLVSVTVDLSGVFTAIDGCCQKITENFQSTFTVLLDLKNTLTRCDLCAIFTVLQEIEGSIAGLSGEVNYVFTALIDLKNSLTECCEDIDTQFAQTWTILLDLKNTLTRCDLCGIYTVLDRNRASIIATYSSLEDLRSTITICCENLIATATTILSGCSSSLITQAAVDAGGGQFVISVTGIYSLAENISSAGGPSGAIILIACSDVTLNMCGKSITASLATTPSGIVITDNLSNITVKNGTVIDAYTALLVSGGSSDIAIDRFAAFRWRNFGIVFFGITGLTVNPIHNCTIAESVIFSGASDPLASVNYGIFLAHCVNCRIADTKVTNNSGVAPQFVVGCHLQECSNCEIADSFFNNNGTYGLLLTAARGTSLERCQMNGNGVANSAGAGIRAGLSTDTAITDCQASFNRGNPVAGISFENNRGTVIQGCVAQGNVGNGAGFTLIQENAGVLKNCVALANTAAILGFEMSGFLLQTGTAVTCQECIAEFNQGDQDTAGFRFIGQESSSIIDCVSKNNLSALADAYGIAIETDSVSNFPSTNNFIRNNDVQSNAGTTGSFGIADDAVNASTSLVAGNFAFNHATNYSVSYASGALVPVTGSFSGALPAVTLGGTYDNLDINP